MFENKHADLEKIRELLQGASLNDFAQVEEIVQCVKKEKMKEEKEKAKMAKWYNERKDFVGMQKPSPTKQGRAVYDKWRRWNAPSL